ncbi:MAG: 2OG-Fe(II) oxygenase [Sphingomonadales bacterium]|nr:2OG-Fe(II) oxygenase [Sphingomonadales bacterium]
MSTSDASLLAGRIGIQRFPSPALDLFLQKRFLSAEECAALVERIDAQRRPSTLADDYGYEGFRTSETCDLAGSDPIVAAINAKLSDFAGLDEAHGEPLQGQRYAVGQEFKAHTDYFEPGGLDYETYCSRSGNRTWTMMVYLNEPKAGGATRFTQIGKTIQPETGKLVAWNNRLPDGPPNPATIHHGMKVRAGTKYIITRWYRELVWNG